MSRAGDQRWQWVRDERLRLGSVLATLTEDQWSVPSLCAGWTVRDVAAHVISAPTATPRDVARDLVGLMGFNRRSDEHVRRLGRRPVEEIVADYRRFADSRRHPVGTSVADMLMDVLVHTQDIAVPLGVEVAAPLPAVVVAADRAHRVSFIFGTRPLVRQVRLVATDVAWTRGRGAPLYGPLGQLLLVVAGRGRVATGLTGPGVAAVPGAQLTGRGRPGPRRPGRPTSP